MYNLPTLAITIVLIFSVTSISGRIKCPRVVIENGRVQTKYRGRINKYNCFQGYLMLGEPYTACIRGKWNPDPPVCLKPGCTPIRNFKNGLIAASMRSALMEFSCKPGYKLVGPSFIYCNGRKWSSMQPYCKAADISCNFEGDNTCSWLVDTHDDDDFMWNVLQHEPPSRLLGTGPNHDHTLSPNDTGHYLMIESSDYGSQVPLPARIHSPKFPVPSDNNTCFIFWYHMFGSTVGLLNIFINNKLVFHESGNHGDRWIKGIVPLTQNDTDLQLMIEGTHGIGYTGNIGLDDFSIGNSTDCVFTKVNSCEGRCYVKAPDTSPCICTSDCFVDSSCCIDYEDFCGTGSSTISSSESFDYDTDSTENDIETEIQEESVSYNSSPSQSSNEMDTTESLTISSETNSHSSPTDHKISILSTYQPIQSSSSTLIMKETKQIYKSTFPIKENHTTKEIESTTINNFNLIPETQSVNPVSKLSTSGKQLIYSVNKFSTVSEKQSADTVNRLSTISGKQLMNTVNKFTTISGGQSANKLNTMQFVNTVNKFTTISGGQSVTTVNKLNAISKKQSVNTIDKLSTISGKQTMVSVNNLSTISGIHAENKFSTSGEQLTNKISAPSGGQSGKSTNKFKSTLKQVGNTTNKFSVPGRQPVTKVNNLSTDSGEHLIQKMNTLGTKSLNEVNKFSTSTEVVIQKIQTTASTSLSHLNPHKTITSFYPTTQITIVNGTSVNMTFGKKANKTQFPATSTINAVKTTSLPTIIKSTLPQSIMKVFSSQKPSIATPVLSTIQTTYETTVNPVNKQKSIIYKKKIPKKYWSNSTFIKKENIKPFDDVTLKKSFKLSTTLIPFVNYKKKIWLTPKLFPISLKPKLLNTTIANGQKYSKTLNAHIRYDHFDASLKHNVKNESWSTTEIPESYSLARKIDASLDIHTTATSDKKANLSLESLSKAQGNFHVLSSNKTSSSSLHEYILPGILIIAVLTSGVVLAYFLTKRRSRLKSRNGSEGDVLYVSSEEMFDFNLARPNPF